jgi:hypothetical protein
MVLYKKGKFQGVSRYFLLKYGSGLSGNPLKTLLYK